MTLALAPLLIAVGYWLFRTKVQDPTQLPELPPVEAAADAEQEATEPSPAEPAAEEGPAEEGDEAAAQEDSGQEQPVQLEFISAAPSTKKIVVKCGSETQRSQDGAPVTLSWADSAVQCRVTAMTEGGRKVAFFEVEQPGVYRCFEEDKAECRRLP